MSSTIFVEELRAKARGLREMAKYFKRNFSGRRGVGQVQIVYRTAANALDALIAALDAEPGKEE